MFAGLKHRQRFLCELRVEGFSYAGAGNSTTKKEAQANACKDFINYLVRSGDIPASDVPNTITEVAPANIPQKDENAGQEEYTGPEGQRASVFQVCFKK